jgi:imidazolonepropionase-like amidohydrolase
MDRERVLPDHTVVVEHGRIASMGPRVKTPVPSGAVRVDGAGKHLLPGPADMHVHLLGDETTNERMLDLLLAKWRDDGAQPSRLAVAPSVA